MSQYDAATKAIRSRSRSTTRRGRALHPAGRPRLTLRQRTGETSQPTRRSRMRRVSAASTRPSSTSRFATASVIADWVISWNTMRFTGTLGLRCCSRCHEMISPRGPRPWPGRARTLLRSDRSSLTTSFPRCVSSHQAVVDVHAEALGGEIGDVPDGGADVVAVAQMAGDGLGLGRRLDDDEGRDIAGKG